MRIRTLAGPPLEREIISDVLRSILLTDASMSTGAHGRDRSRSEFAAVTELLRPPPGPTSP